MNLGSFSAPSSYVRNTTLSRVGTRSTTGGSPGPAARGAGGRSGVPGAGASGLGRPQRRYGGGGVGCAGAEGDAGPYAGRRRSSAAGSRRGSSARVARSARSARAAASACSVRSGAHPASGRTATVARADRADRAEERAGMKRWLRVATARRGACIRSFQLDRVMVAFRACGALGRPGSAWLCDLGCRIRCRRAWPLLHRSDGSGVPVASVRTHMARSCREPASRTRTTDRIRVTAPGSSTPGTQLRATPRARIRSKQP